MFERFFYSWGCTVASNPWKFIAATLVITGLGSLGLLDFRAETNGWKMWLPEGSRYSLRQQWKNEHFVEDVRGTITLFGHEENVLTPEAMLLLLDLHENVRAVEFEGRNYNDACMKVPISNILPEKSRRKKRHNLEKEAPSWNLTEVSEPIEKGDYPQYEEYFNFYGTEIIEEEEGLGSVDDKLEGLPKDIYCDIVETLEGKCGEFSLLEIWKSDKDVISNLTEQDIINAINSVDESPVFGHNTNFINYLGRIEYNLTGHVVRAKSIRSIWLERFNPDNIPPTDKLGGVQLDQVDPFTLGYENEVLRALKEWRDKRDKEDGGYSLNMNLGLSYSTEASGPIKYDTQRQIFGYVLMFTYTMLSLGKINIVENKFYLAIAGILSVFFGVTVGIGLTMAMGFPYTPISGILPFICLGIGIDDMFVIVRCFDNISQEEKKKSSLVTNIGLAMKHAGASITITSVTDICAFATGAITSFPSLQSFCISASLAITAIYLFQISWFVAWMALDEKRIRQKRNGLFPFIVHKDWQPPSWSNNNVFSAAIGKMSQLLESTIFRVVIVMLTVAMLAVGIWGVLEIRVGYAGVSLVPKDSYFRAWVDQNELDFPSDGYGINFYTQELSYTMEDFEKIEVTVNELHNLTVTHNEWVHYGKELPKSVQTPWEVATGFWWYDFKEFIANHRDVKNWRDAFAEEKFPIYLSDFLHHEDGSSYKGSFRFSGNLECDSNAPPITAMKLGALKLRDLKGLGRITTAQHTISDILSSKNVSLAFADSFIYPAWEVTEIVGNELYQNILIALACVFVIILITLQNLRVCLFTLSCVLFTLIDVIGVIYSLGMVIDSFTVYCFVIGIGLSVDYGAHIAHSFIISEGTPKQRAKDGFVYISPAIVHGGVSTFLAITPLAFSQSHAFATFFNMISLMVVFGIFHGLFYLPAMLSLFGDNKEGGDRTEDLNLHGPNKKESTNNNVYGIDNADFQKGET